MAARIGILVNPVAGMGGSVGLKGTDGEMYVRAVELGATPVTPERMLAFLHHLDVQDKVDWYTAPGLMGADLVAGFDLDVTVVGTIGDKSSAADTRRIAAEMVARGVELLVFAGGDGTARDIYDAIDGKVPVVAVPCGVKSYSSVFAVSPRAAAEMVQAFVAGAGTVEEEVLDIDEDAFREGRLTAQLYGALRVPNARQFLQPGKESSSGLGASEESKHDIAARIVEDMRDDTLYLLGPGTTVAAIGDALGIEKSLLGIDAVYAGELVASDVNEQGILSLLDKYNRCVIIVTPIGGNGFIFGRGNKQLTPAVLRRVGKQNVTVVSTRAKLAGLTCLRVDTGDPAVDEAFAGYVQVWVSHHERKMMPVEW